MNIRKFAALGLISIFCIGYLAYGFECEKLMIRHLNSSDISHMIGDAENKMLANISPAGTVPGTVIASPSRSNPNYYFMWIRDAALTMDVVHDRASLMRYFDLSVEQQKTGTLTGLGEPKFNVDGTAFNGPWGRPQNDGPALRALTAIKFAEQLLANGESDLVRTKFYDGRLPSSSLIKTDLEYIAHHWQEPNYDLWEEVYGRHFYTLLAQKAALSRGGDLADKLGDGAAANFYHTQARAIESALNEFWDGHRGYILAILDQERGPDHSSGLDVSVILATLHATHGGETFGVTDDRILATALKLKESFAALYQVNQRPEFRDLGTAIGRYPEDHYTGYTSEKDTLANPWFLATNAFAELHYRASRQFSTDGEIKITALNQPFFESLREMQGVTVNAGQVFKKGSPTFDLIVKALVEDGDRYIERTRIHGNNGHYSEQFDRDSGYSMGAVDLTWSYASLITALRARP